MWHWNGSRVEVQHMLWQSEIFQFSLPPLRVGKRQPGGGGKCSTKYELELGL